jgi:hypothetical protein
MNMEGKSLKKDVTPDMLLGRHKENKKADPQGWERLKEKFGIEGEVEKDGRSR